jgi:hypothetical protein
MKMDFKELYNQLKGTKNINGEFTILDFTDEDYENLYYTLLEMLSPFIGENYEYWYMQKARSFHKYKQSSRKTYDFFDPQYEKPLETQTIREQLATIKYFIPPSLELFTILISYYGSFILSILFY